MADDNYIDDAYKKRPSIPKEDPSQADIDKMSYGEAFKYFRGKGAGTKFTWRGSKQAAYRKGEEPDSWKKKAAPAKAEDKPAPKAETKPAAAAPAPKAAPKAAPSSGNSGAINRSKPSADTVKYSFWDNSGKRHDVDFPSGTTPDQADSKFATMSFARGGGVERKGKTDSKVVRMAKGGSIDGCVQRGKTKCKYR